MSEHQELKICIGVKPAAGDSSSAETGYEEITLLGASTGLQLIPGGDGWVPQIAQAKAGIWRDGPYTPGRTPDALPVANVIETMKCQITAGTHQEVYRYIEALNRFIARARAFFADYAEIEPVFLHWWAWGASGPQFALLYNIDAAIGDISNVGTEDPTVTVTLTLEREPAWRWQVPPGGNPKLWTLRNQSTIPLSDLVLNVLSPGNDLVVATVYNRHEIDPANEAVPIKTNYIDIAANLIPGDAPALITLATRVGDNANSKERKLFVARNTKAKSMIDRDADGAPNRQRFMLNAGDADFDGADISIGAATYGNLSNGSAASTYHISGNITGSSTTTFYIIMRANLFRGIFAAFVRSRQTSGASGDVDMRMVLNWNNIYPVIYTNWVNMLLCTPTSGRGEYLPLYLGEIQIPPNAPGLGDDDGRGLSADTMAIEIQMRNNNASARGVQVLDIVLIPLDESVVMLNAERSATQTAQGPQMMFDNTGYFGRRPDATGTDIYNAPLEVRGDLVLEPNRDNRLYFFNTSFENSPVTCEFSGSTGLSAITDMVVNLNIVPRSYGPRTD